MNKHAESHKQGWGTYEASCEGSSWADSHTKDWEPHVAHGCWELHELALIHRPPTHGLWSQGRALCKHSTTVTGRT